MLVVSARIATAVASASEACSASSDAAERRGVVQWDVGDLPTMVETHRNGHVMRGYPALVDDDDSVSLRILSNPDLQARVMRGGVRRLLLLTAAPTRKAVERGLSNAGRLAVIRSGRSLDDLVAQCIAAAADRVLSDHGSVPFTAAGFEALRRQAKELLHEHAADALATAGAILALATSIDLQLQRMIAPVVRPSADDARGHMQRLTRPGFVRSTGTRRLRDVLRYLQGIERRLDRLAGELPRDQQRMREVQPIEQRYAALLRTFGNRPVPPEVVDLGWMLEELRISVFAQALGTNGPISLQRVQRELERLGG
jgi:ATP-dependent helicase HrpA